jgi:hypothetical protein
MGRALAFVVSLLLPLATLTYSSPPTRRSDAGPEPSQPRSAISSPSHNSQRRRASGRAICCPCTKVISRRWQSEIKPRTWASFWKQCHSPLALRQYMLSVSPSGVSSIGTRIKHKRGIGPRRKAYVALFRPRQRAAYRSTAADPVEQSDLGQVPGVAANAQRRRGNCNSARYLVGLLTTHPRLP